MSAHTTVRIQWAHPETDTMYVIRCSVTAGCAARGPSYSSGGEPAEPPEVDILSARDEKHQDRPEIVDLLEREHMAEIEEAALAEAANREEDAMEMAADAAREGW